MPYLKLNNHNENVWSIVYSASGQSFDINAGQEYLIEVRCKINTSVGGFEVWVNGVKQFSGLSVNTGSALINNIVLGIYGNPGNICEGSEFYFDEIKISDTYIGPLISSSSIVEAIEFVESSNAILIEPPEYITGEINERSISGEIREQYMIGEISEQSISGEIK